MNYIWEVFNLKLNKIFTSHMVFPANKTIKIYGEGNGKGRINFAGQIKEINSDGGKWCVEFPPMEYGGPYEIKVLLNDEEIVLEDIFVGEVFLFAGPSNMQFKIKESKTPQELIKSNNNLRLYSTDRIEKTDAFTSDDGWKICKEDEIGEWSAIAYLAGNELTKLKNVAIGIIVCYQGASVIESWLPNGTLEKLNINIPIENKLIDHTFHEFVEWNQNGKLYEYALSQVTPFQISGVVWYQGESDTTIDESLVYLKELCALIDVLRNDFCDDDLKFIIVQLADYSPRDDEAWKNVQKAQIEVQKIRKNVITVIAADVCEKDNIHPPTKYKLAKRIAQALN